MTRSLDQAGWLRRALRHAASTRAKAARAFPPDALDAIAQAVTDGERTHRGEVCVIVEKALPFAAVRAGVDNRQRALALFADYGVWDTEDNCGVLIYINLADRKVDIVTDRGVGRKIPASTWQGICTAMTQGFAQEKFQEATLEALREVNALLGTHFPANGTRANELPDRPRML